MEMKTTINKEMAQLLMEISNYASLFVYFKATSS